MAQCVEKRCSYTAHLQAKAGGTYAFPHSVGKCGFELVAVQIVLPKLVEQQSWKQS
ncbi:hypothetical protein ZHAS_00006925 [Anopheles sinensis]|uniref:Uncharacterized protein n=1 Tax=Anopheles sinensis TaxID=74873 RepID=A0A084VN91_ANOSI|nr:hypothetical protein ZHAS_00006925 [Anopheles sinensis]